MNDEPDSSDFISTLPLTREELTAWVLANAGTGRSTARQEIDRMFPPVVGKNSVHLHRRAQYFKTIRIYVQNWVHIIEREWPDVEVKYEIEPDLSAVGYYTEIYVAGVKVL